MDVVALEREVHDKLINCIVDFVFPFQVVIHDAVGLGLRIRNNQGFGDGEVQFSSRQPVDFCDFLHC
jgi:hypothetical protein